MDPDCIFCKIVADAIPSTRVYEDEHTIAFMDIGPVASGHVLVIPRAHHNPITDTPDAVLHQVISVVRKVAIAQMKGLEAKGVNVTQANGAIAGQVVPHLHFHVIPRIDDDAKDPTSWHPGQYDTPDALRETAARIREAIEQ